MIKKEDIETSLVTSIAKSDLKEIVSDIAEISLDTFFDDGIIKDVPIIGSLAKLYSAGKNIQEKIFEKKIIAFLLETEKAKKESKNKFYDDLNNNESLRKKVGEQILVILEKIDDLEKPTILGKLFKNFIEEEINFEMFHRLATIIANCFLPDLKKLSIYKDKSQFNTFTSISLENSGLVHMYYVRPEIFDADGNQTGGSLYRITKLGQELLKLGII
ncbi:hypothetical protein [Flavobacterium sp. Root186]|uniref:hypothetical protein n=1 Tax=Flavobacterium sp. Root186 TaxID=1736485 RepID=UPI0006FA3B20|nr:hypothetical protein [Flavobacterium sp. Root186]KRB57167.1 hypothetical protein ASD98_02460 [Flavobacterium sp. Root186]